MTIPQWTEALSVGHRLLDGHHRALFQLANRAAAMGAEDPTPDAVRTLLNELRHYTNYHFSEEERLMAESGFPFLDLHKDAHKGIALRLDDLYDSVAEKPANRILSEAALFLANWLIHHIEIEDFVYKDYLAEPR